MATSLMLMIIFIGKIDGRQDVKGGLELRHDAGAPVEDVGGDGLGIQAVKASDAAWTRSLAVERARGFGA
jgi:hypothetical protein